MQQTVQGGGIENGASVVAQARPFAIVPTVGYVALGAAIMLGAVFLPAVVIVLINAALVTSMPIALSLQAGADIVLVPYLLYAIRRLGQHVTPTMFALSAPVLGWGLVFGVGSVIVVDGITTIAARVIPQLGDSTQNAVVITAGLHGLLPQVLFFAFAVLLAPLAEELCFRGLIFNSFRQYMALPAAAALSGIVFGFAHFDVLSLLPLSIAGMILAMAYAKTNSLWTSFTAHAVFNTVGVAMALLHF